MTEPHTLFVSDLHLETGRPDITRLFTRFLEQRARQADALYILGDLFEVWVGDDHPVDGLEDCLQALKVLSANVPVYLMHGNRDFLIGAQFADKHGIELLDEHCVIDLYGQKALLLHGDTLCIDDEAYQQFRAQVRNPLVQKEFLKLPLTARLEQARKIRQQSGEQTALKDEIITDVNQDEVVRVMREHGVNLLIHGHTHRPAEHRLDLVGAEGTRIVLADWYEEGEYLACSPSGINRVKLPADSA